MKKINLELEIEDEQEISIKINLKDNKIYIKEEVGNRRVEEKEKVVAWIFENYPKYRLPLPQNDDMEYEELLDKVIDNFSKAVK